MCALGSSTKTNYKHHSRCVTCKINYPLEQVFCTKCKRRVRHSNRGTK